MSEFINRTGLNLNKKILNVSKVTRNQSGEIITLEVEVIRNDEDGLMVEGTPLNASNFNNIINEMIDSRVHSALVNYHENQLAIIETAEVTLLADGSCAMYDGFSIYAPENVVVDVENNYDEYFIVSAPTTATTGNINIGVTAIQDPDYSGATEFQFDVRLYSQETNDLIKRVTCQVTFQVPSITPDD